MSCFLDTNILLSAKSTPASEQGKRVIAAKILDRDDCVISVQVLQEFHAQATRPNKPHTMSHSDAVGLIHTWRRFEVRAQTLEVLDTALQICGRMHFSYWDSAIIAAALMSNCDTLYTEDLQHGQVIDHVTVVKPFAG
jgi:predicted nucleic acid-binding protein